MAGKTVKSTYRLASVALWDIFDDVGEHSRDKMAKAKFRKGGRVYEVCIPATISASGAKELKVDKWGGNANLGTTMGSREGGV